MKDHRNSITLDLGEWDNCFGNIYAGSTPSHPKFWSYLTQEIRTESEVVKINTCISVALINSGEKVAIDYMFDNNNSAYVMVNDVNIGIALQLSEAENKDVLTTVREASPEIVGLKEALDQYMNSNNYAQKWTENLY